MEEYFVWLQQAFEIGCKTSDQLLESHTPLEVYRLMERGAPPACLNEQQVERLRSSSRKKAMTLCEKTVGAGYHIIPYGTAYYPAALQCLTGKPVVLYAHGQPESLHSSFCITVIGSREISSYARYVTANISYNLAKAGVTVVGGFALGGDSAGHHGALAAGGKTIAVLGCGLDLPYPHEHAALTHTIARSGVRVTEYPLGAKPLAYRFPARNRLLAAMGLGVFVAEARQKSGALITVNEAADLGKDIFVAPGNIYNENARGTLQLLKDGASVVGSARDILDAYRNLPVFSSLHPAYIESDTPLPKSFLQTLPGADGEPRNTAAPPPLPQEAAAQPPCGSVDALSTVGRQVYDLIGREPSPLPMLIEKTGLSSGEIMACITELELEGLILARPGRSYVRRA